MSRRLDSDAPVCPVRWLALFFQQWIFQFLALFQVGQGDTAGQVAHLAEAGLPLGHPDGAAGIHAAKGVRALEHIIMGGDDQPLGQAGFGLGPVEVVHLAQAAYIGHLIIIFAVLELLLAAELSIFDGLVPGLVPNGSGVIEGDQDAVQAVGDLDGDGVEALAADLLEIGELGDLLPVQPDLPAQPPGRDGQLLPVVFHQADIVLARVDADGLERLQIEFHRVARDRA